MTIKKLIVEIILLIEIIIIIYLILVNQENSPLYGGGPPLRQSYNSKLEYELVPNSVTKFDGYAVRLPKITIMKINSDGFRDREYSIEKPNNTFRIIILGDSLTFGLGVELNETYPKVLERKLNSLKNRINYEVLNFGVPGYDIQQKVEMFKIKGMKYNFDMIILQFLVEDAINNSFRKSIRNEIRSLNPDLSHIEIEFKAGEKEDEFIKNLNIQELERIIGFPLATLSNVTRENNISVLITYVCNENQLKVIKEITSKNKWKVLDINRILSEFNPNDYYLHKLDPHYNKFGNEVVASGIFNFLIENDMIR